VCLRVGGVIFLPMLVHALWDFSLFSPGIGPDTDAYLGTALPVLAQVVLIVVVLRRRRKTGVAEEPNAVSAPSTA
jgi:uncharacterized protein